MSQKTAPSSESPSEPETAPDISPKITTPKKSGKIPTASLDAPLKIDEVISGPEIPQSDINAPLKVETDPQALAGENQEKSNKKLFAAGSIIGAIIVMAAIGFYFYLPKNNQDESTKQPAQSTVQAQPQPEFVRSDWSLEILNGSGVAGAAKKAADSLASLGYKIIKIGNADLDVSNTQILTADSLSTDKDKLLTDVQKDFPQAALSGQLTDSTASARIIIGKN